MAVGRERAWDREKNKKARRVEEEEEEDGTQEGEAVPRRELDLFEITEMESAGA